MDSVKSVDTTERYRFTIRELFRETASGELYDTWADTFDIEIESEKQVTVVYHGTEPVKMFKAECMETVTSCIYSVMGTGKKIRVRGSGSSIPMSSKAKKNLRAVKFFALAMVFVCMATAVVVVMCSYIGNRSFRETFYSASSIKVDSRIRVIQLSDLHGASYGKNNKKLVERIEALLPDIIICTGDMVDSVEEDGDLVADLCRELAEIAPSYYVYGNNEVESVYGFPLNEKELDEKFGFDKTNRDETALLKLKDSFEEKLESTGIRVLKNEKDRITVKNMTVDVYGVLNSNPSSFWSYSEKAFGAYIEESPDNLKITAVHEPFIFEEFSPEFWGDLLVCGHTHGGVVRVPVLGPLFTKEGGLLPEREGDFVYGRYDAAGKPLIVSSGLEHNNILRINNQPELVIIDINKF